jgi:hypothetical protein
VGRGGGKEVLNLLFGFFVCFELVIGDENECSLSRRN